MAFIIANHSTVVAAAHQISSDLAGETVILNLDSSIYYGLDSVGTRIWNLLQQPRTVGEIRDALVAEYDVEPERAERDLIALLQKLNEVGLVELSSPTTA